jgi:hypothetical protein
LVGYTIHLRVEATPFFTGDIAVATLKIKLLATGDQRLFFTNTFNIWRFKRAFKQSTPVMQLLIPPCLLETQTEKAFMDALDYKVEVFGNLDCATGTATTTEFNKRNMNFDIPAKTYLPG